MNTETYFTVVMYVLYALFGLCIGSFLNVVIYRVPNKMSIAFPASHCPNCNYKLKWYDNIPVISYIILGGKCRNCKQHISFRYTVTEIANAALAVLSAYMFANKSVLFSIVAAVSCSVLICIFFIDLENMIILDRFNIILAALAVLAIFVYGFEYSGRTKFISNIIGAVFGFGSFWLIAVVSEKILKKEALGGGDIKLCGVMGLYLGWQKLLLAVLISSVAGSIILLILGKKNRNSQKAYPFAPFLVSGFTVSLFFGDAILNWYLSLLL